MSAATYQVVIQLLGSFAALVVLFGLGVLIGWLIWKGKQNN